MIDLAKKKKKHARNTGQEKAVRLNLLPCAGGDTEVGRPTER